MKKRIVWSALLKYKKAFPCFNKNYARALAFFLTSLLLALFIAHAPQAFAAGEKKTDDKKKGVKKENSAKTVTQKVKSSKNKSTGKQSTNLKQSDNKKNKNEEKDKTLNKIKKGSPQKNLKLDLPDGKTDEIIINSKKYKLGGLSLEKKGAAPKKSKIGEIKKLAGEVKKEFEELKKANPRKKNRYSLNLPESYHQVDMKLANEIMRRVNLSSLSMFKTLYLPHLKKARSVKNKSVKGAHADSALDDRTKMALLIVGNFINEAIEKHDSGNLSKTHKNFGKWITDGANLLAYGTIYPAESEAEASSKKHKRKKGIISFSTAKKLLRALIEVESSAVQMRQGRVNISLNMRTYPRDGSYVIGFMQESVDDFAKGVNLFDPEINIKYTCKKLHKYLLKYNGNYDKTLRHYNAGQGNMDCEQAHRYSAKVHRFMERF
ncbi:MAG TPA: transglycosylase SLT domain-containing protein [Candidatus Wallbacteria bacterium]|nr:transglycosylase SLT domain-containing protein [Candidatus Wallbacteria bacterium]